MDLKTRSDIFEYNTVVPESLGDFYGHLNHAGYLVLFEEARWAFVRHFGWGEDEVKRRGQGPVVLEAKVRYQREVKQGEKILVTTQAHDYQSRLGYISQVMYAENHEAACTGEFTFGLFDLNKRKLVKPAEDWYRAVGLL